MAKICFVDNMMLEILSLIDQWFGSNAHLRSKFIKECIKIVILMKTDWGLQKVKNKHKYKYFGKSIYFIFILIITLSLNEWPV